MHPTIKLAILIFSAIGAALIVAPMLSSAISAPVAAAARPDQTLTR